MPEESKTTRRWVVGGRPAAGADPAADLSPTAARILEARKRLLDERGFGGLTFEAIAAEAHENKASIRYHFGNKAGLIEALAELGGPRRQRRPAQGRCAGPAAPTTVSA